MLGLKSNKQSTALTDADWVALAANRHGVHVLVEGQTVIDTGPYGRVLGAFAAEAGSGRDLRVMSHTDYVTELMAEPTHRVVYQGPHSVRGWSQRGTAAQCGRAVAAVLRHGSLHSGRSIQIMAEADFQDAGYEALYPAARSVSAAELTGAGA
jgi:hypothetical protein